jgi:hypothetical protein
LEKNQFVLFQLIAGFAIVHLPLKKKKKKKKKKNRRTFEKSFFFFFVFTHLHSLEIKDARNCACSSWPMWQSNRRQGEC